MGRQWVWPFGCHHALSCIIFMLSRLVHELSICTKAHQAPPPSVSLIPSSFPQAPSRKLLPASSFPQALARTQTLPSNSFPQLSPSTLFSPTSSLQLSSPKPSPTLGCQPFWRWPHRRVGQTRLRRLGRSRPILCSPRPIRRFPRRLQAPSSTAACGRNAGGFSASTSPPN